MLPEAIGAELGAVEYVRPGVYVAMLGYGWPRTSPTRPSLDGTVPQCTHEQISPNIPVPAARHACTGTLIAQHRDLGTVGALYHPSPLMNPHGISPPALVC